MGNFQLFQFINYTFKEESVCYLHLFAKFLLVKDINYNKDHFDNKTVSIADLALKICSVKQVDKLEAFGGHSQYRNNAYHYCDH